MSAELLKNVYLFKGLEITELVDILKICHPVNLPKDKVIFLEGDPGDRCYIIEDGAVRISKNIPGVGEEALKVLRNGDYFGEMSLIDGASRSATAIANEDTTCLVIAKADLDRLLAEDKELGNKILMVFCRTLSQRLRDTNDKISQFFLMTAGSGGHV
jgi:CRP-like cAMP-binding protein